MLPRTGCRGVPEAPDYAIYRGQVDIALCSVLSDGGLRRSVAAALAWGDVEIAADGSGRVRIARPKTDQEGGGEFVAITPSTVQALEAIRNGAGDDSSVFGMSDSTSTTMKSPHQSLIYRTPAEEHFVFYSKPSAFAYMHHIFSILWSNDWGQLH